MDDGVVVLVAGQVAVALPAQVAGRVAGQVALLAQVVGRAAVALVALVGGRAVVWSAPTSTAGKTLPRTCLYPTVCSP